LKKGILQALLGAVVMASLILAGCGGGDDETASLTRAEFIEQGNAVCKAAEKERGELLQGAEKLNKPGETLDKAGKEKLVITVAAKPYRKMAEELEALGAPEGEEERVEAIIEAMKVASQQAEENPIKVLEEIGPFAKPNKLIEEFGMKGCLV
jgi:hypothetical protein